MTFWIFFWILVLFLWAGVAIYNSLTAHKKNLSGEGKYLCVPCWYIYDPVEGDPDSGIAAGTKFEDIPDDWRCPVCWVTKADFIPLGNEHKKVICVEIVKHEFINKNQDVVLLKVKSPKKFEVKPGQYFSFVYTDEKWEFRRCYSVVKVKGDVYTFLVRIERDSRSGNILKNKQVWDTLEVYGVFWNFKLQPTDNRKVFIGTGTGLAPLYHMILENHKTNNILIFWCKDMNDIFYLEELSLDTIENVYIYLSREENIPQNHDKIVYKKWRLDICEFLQEHPQLNNDQTEFYLCWNPNLVDNCVSNLEKEGRKLIFTEKF